MSNCNESTSEEQQSETSPSAEQDQVKTSPGTTPKGILKNTKPNEHVAEDSVKEASFDEMNILATYHPADKDYGMMPINEPKTPFNRVDAHPSQPVSPEMLSKKLGVAESNKRKSSGFLPGVTDRSILRMSTEEKEHVKEFEEHRKQHYNMKLDFQRGRELAAHDLSDLEED